MDRKFYNVFVKENFDLTDMETLRIVTSINEADQDQMMASLAAKLYDKIISKVADIDYGTIPASKGDITKIANYQDMMDCIDTIKEIITHYKQDTSQIDIVSEAVENVRNSKRIWEKAFNIKCEIPALFYNTITLAIVSSISYLISASIEFIKDPTSQSFQIAFDKVGYTKTKDKLLFTNLQKFNSSYRKGEIEKTMESILRAETGIKEAVDNTVTEAVEFAALFAAIGGGIMLIGLLSTIIPILHELTSLFYILKQSVSDYFAIQAQLIQFNAETLKYDTTRTPAEVEKIYTKQNKIAQVFKKISNLFAIKMTKAEKDATKAIESDSKEKYKASEVMDTMPSSSIF